MLPFSSKSMFHIHMNIPPKRNSSLETFIFSFNLNTSILLLEVLFNRPKSNVSTRNHLTSLIQPLYRMTETVFQILYLIEVRMARLVYFREGSNFPFKWLFSFNPTWSVSAQTLGTYGSLYFSFFIWSGQYFRQFLPPRLSILCPFYAHGAYFDKLSIWSESAPRALSLR